MKLNRYVDRVRRVWSQGGDLLLAAGCFLLSLMIYLQTLAPSVATLFDDSLEFPLVCYRLGIAHPTGYPFYTLLGKLFTLGPWHNVAWAVNLLSAVAGAATLALIYLVARELTCRRLPAFLGVVAMAVSPIFWSQAVIAEVYTLNSTLVAALLWLVLRWARRPLLPIEPFCLLQASPKGKGMLFLPGEGVWARLPRAVRRTASQIHMLYRRFFPPVPPKFRLRLSPLTYTLAALYGLSLTHHRTVLLLVPPVFTFVLLVERRVFSRAALLGPEHPNRSRWLQVASRPTVLLVACVFIPTLLYLYLPLRGQVGSLDGTYANTLRGFWHWVTASGYGVFFDENPLARDLDAAFYAELFWQQFGPIGLALAVVGLIGLVRQSKTLALSVLAFVMYTAFGIMYRVPDVEVFLIPAFLSVAIWIAVGLDYAVDLLHPRGPSLVLRRLLASCLLLLFLAAVVQPIAIAVGNYPDLDLSRRWIAHDYAQYVLNEPLPPNSTVVGLLGEMTLLRYFQDTTGLRSDVETIAADDEAARRQAVEEALGRGRTVYITRPLPGLAEDYALDAVIGLIDVAGDLQTLIRVGDPDYEPPELPRSTDLVPLASQRLFGYGVHEHRAHWQAWVRLRLWWQGAGGGLKESTSFKVSARLLDADGHTVGATDAEPVSGAYATNAWRPGEVVADAYEIPLPAGLPPGEYTPLVVVYESVTGVERARPKLPPIHLQGNPVRPPRRELEASIGRTVYARFGDVELLGFTPPDPGVTYHPGDTLPLTLLWQARGQPSDYLRVAFRLGGDRDVPLGEQKMGGRFTTDRWDKGQVVRQWSDLRLPEGIPAGTYRLKMRVSRDGRPLPWSRGLIPAGNDLDLGPVQVGR